MDKLALMRGQPYHVTESISIINPTIGQIEDFGEIRYWGMLSQLCSTSFDHRLSLEELGIDYLTVDDWHMFLNSRYALIPEETEIILPGVNFPELKLYEEESSGRLILQDDTGNIKIDEMVYTLMVDFIRECHGLQRNYKIPGNAAAREVYMREAREAREFAGRRQPKSTLEPLVSALCNAEGFKYNYDTVWDVNIYNFMDALKRIQKINSANHLLGGIYGGMLDTSKMNKGQLNKDLNWMGEL